MMRKLLIILTLAASTSLPALAEVRVNIGLHVPAYPDLQPIPGYPVYYAPGMRANYFFYDGDYWVYLPDGWYVSPWYDGPWRRVAIDSVPLFVLRVPVRYYGYRPVTFRRWGMDAPPRWDVVWGPRWARRHHDWNRWNRAVVPPPAPLPSYQERYPRGSYPNDAQRRELHEQHYSFAPRESHAPRQWRPRPADIARQPQQVHEQRRPEPRFIERDHLRQGNHVLGPREPAPDPRPAPAAIGRNPGPHGPAHNGRPEHPPRQDHPGRGAEHGQGKQR